MVSLQPTSRHAVITIWLPLLVLLVTTPLQPCTSFSTQSLRKSDQYLALISRLPSLSSLSKSTTTSPRKHYELLIPPLSPFKKINKRHSTTPTLHLSSSQSQYDDTTDDDDIISQNIIPTVASAAISLRRTCWLSWWSQVILTTVSTVTLIFARSIRDSSDPLKTSGGFFLAGTGVSLSILSIIWTWGGRRLSRRLLRRREEVSTARGLLRRAVTVGVGINLLGMLVTLVGAELIVGRVLAKVLTVQGVGPMGGGGGYAAAAVAAEMLQPLDILVVQANTNTLLSHFMGLWLRLWFSRWILRLEQGEEEEEEE